MSSEATTLPNTANGPNTPGRGFLGKLLSLLSDSAVYGISSLLSQVIGFLLLPLYTRYLTPTDQGVIAMVAVVTAFVTPLSRLGLINAIFRRFNLDKSPEARREMLSTALVGVTISSVVCVGTAVILAAPLSQLAVGDASAAGIVVLNLVGAAVATIGTVPLAVLRADRRVKTMAAINVLKLLSVVGTTIVLVVGWQWSVWGVMVGMLVGEVVASTVLIGLTAGQYRHRPSWQTWRSLAAYGLPFVPHQLQALVMTLLGQYAVGNMLGLNEAGLYSTATKFALPVAFVINSVQAAWVAFKFQIHADDEDPAMFFRSTATYYLAGILYLWVGVSLWGPEVVWLLTEEKYHPAAWLIAVTGLIPVSQGIYFLFSTGIELGDDVRSLPLVTFVGLLTTAIFVFFTIRWLGAYAAALSTAMAFLAMTVVIYHLSQRRFKIHYDWPAIAALVVVALAAATGGYLTLNLPALPRVSLAVAISLAFPFVEFAILLRSPTERLAHANDFQSILAPQEPSDHSRR